MKDIAKIILGNILITFSYAFFTVPRKIINGGVTSSALVVHCLAGTNVTTVANILTIILLVSCLLFLGKEYFIKSILSSICYMSFFNLFYLLGFTININIVLAIIISAILVAVGYYLCISSNASTVGFDVIALIINNKNPRIEIASALRFINIIVLLFGLLALGYESIIKGIVFTIIYSSILKTLLKNGFKIILNPLSLKKMPH
ncbi:YitT family protein [Clostridium sp. A1-XYC3]|uniref:YitT family protein n=1 Tax=Clostridium tanneri TaxID=3037988 RepID=A0ABU4JU97_9CLOT|nr:YitT family protein [Clostridium sp. A1-XYC3]MDW8801729.1 YitT family protein [Clostridium sp. A1-XYC3]